jgi:NAD(P)-dependent dehydrogenase (short-subunit alcohol dehydrogenase family)
MAAQHRINVNCIHPGWIDTPTERDFASDEDLQCLPHRLTPRSPLLSTVRWRLLRAAGCELRRGLWAG